MKLRPILPEDYIFDSCGRLVPPPGTAFLNLTRAIPMKGTITGTIEGGIPSPPKTVRMSNQAATIFCCLGIAINPSSGPPLFQIRWPSGKFLQELKTIEGPPVPFPMGQSSLQTAFDKPLYLAPGDSVSVEMSGGQGGELYLQLWGYLQWLVTPVEAAACKVNTACLVGYPVGPAASQPVTNPQQDRIVELENGARYMSCNVGQNLLAVEADLGNQCYEGEPDTFQTQVITLGTNEGSYNNRAAVPFLGRLRIVGMRIRATWAEDWDPDITSDIEYTVRMPNGYSIMSSDMVSNAALSYVPVMPSIPVQGGERISFDVFNRCSADDDTTVDVTVELFLRRVL